MYGDDITVLDTVEPDEFSVELNRLAIRHAGAANWDTAGHYSTASQVIDALLAKIEELEGQVYELEETIDGKLNRRS